MYQWKRERCCIIHHLLQIQKCRTSILWWERYFVQKRNFYYTLEWRRRGYGVHLEREKRSCGRALARSIQISASIDKVGLTNDFTLWRHSIKRLINLDRVNFRSVPIFQCRPLNFGTRSRHPFFTRAPRPTHKTLRPQPKGACNPISTCNLQLKQENGIMCPQFIHAPKYKCDNRWYPSFFFSN